MRTAIAIPAAVFVFSCGPKAPDGVPCDRHGDCESRLCVEGTCGVESDDNDAFACGSVGSCQQGEYCLVSQMDGTETDAQCLTIPSCDSDACGCAYDDAPNHAEACTAEGVKGLDCRENSVVVTCNRTELGN